MTSGAFPPPDQDDGSVDLTGLNWRDTCAISGALIDLILKYPGKDIVVIWDSAAWHKSRELKQELGCDQKPGTSPPDQSTALLP
ncbi:hypothetical protein [uncultured Propionibacterium sp.]|uniref:hypothetical protein n=1 Tax=uncultured Propionibacterium sp. TaxID=218066 RepID=UPI002930942B|nr:hypothetical protein [uncultured Propionibacterium sp.]